MPTLRLGTREIDYAVTLSPRGKRLRVRVSPEGVRIILPAGRTEAEGRAFLERNARWVESQLAFVDRAAGLRKPKTAATGWTIPLQGRATAVRVARDGPARGTRIEHASGEAVLTVRVATGASADTAKRGMVLWLRAKARKALAARIEARAREMHVRPARFFVMSQRTKWGNCSALGNLSFNWRLILAPPDVLDYIVVHELAHLLVPAHTAKFWLLVRSFCPRYEVHREWLRTHAGKLLEALRPGI